MNTFSGAEEVQELTYLRDQNRALIRLIAELKRENHRLERMVNAKKRDALANAEPRPKPQKR